MGLTDPPASRNGATLAACQNGAIAPVRASIAIHIVCAVAAAAGAPAMHGRVSPENIVIGYDGRVELLASGEHDPSGDDDLPPVLAPPSSRLAYMAPEQAAGRAVDRRADVFALGVVLWELLTATRLFHRESAAATRSAILDEPLLDVRDVNPEVPAIVGDVLSTALQRDPDGRFDTVAAFCMALGNARASSELPEASPAEIAKWVAKRVPPPIRRAPPRPSPSNKPPAPALPAAPDLALAPAPAPALSDSVPDFDIPGASRAARSQPSIPGVAGYGSIPKLDVNALAAAALAPPSSRASAPAASAAPTSGRASSTPELRQPSSPSQHAPHAMAFDAGDDDDFDMEIERNTGGHSASMPNATSSRTSGSAIRTSGAHRATGLELSQPSRMKREEAAARAGRVEEPGTAAKLGGLLLALAIAGGTAFSLWNYVHSTLFTKLNPANALPHAFDGSSAPESGAVSLVALVAAVAIGYVGLRYKPHAWAFVASGGALLFLALAMVTVTLASTGESPTPPDGVLLVPYLYPAAMLLLALGVAGRSAKMFARGGIGGRMGFVPVAAIAGVLAFAALQASRFAR